MEDGMAILIPPRCSERILSLEGLIVKLQAFHEALQTEVGECSATKTELMVMKEEVREGASAQFDTALAEIRKVQEKADENMAAFRAEFDIFRQYVKDEYVSKSEYDRLSTVLKQRADADAIRAQAQLEAVSELCSRKANIDTVPTKHEFDSRLKELSDDVAKKVAEGDKRNVESVQQLEVRLTEKGNADATRMKEEFDALDVMLKENGEEDLARFKEVHRLLALKADADMYLTLEAHGEHGKQVHEKMDSSTQDLTRQIQEVSEALAKSVSDTLAQDQVNKANHEGLYATTQRHSADILNIQANDQERQTAIGKLETELHGLGLNFKQDMASVGDVNSGVVNQIQALENELKKKASADDVPTAQEFWDLSTDVRSGHTGWLEQLSLEVSRKVDLASVPTKEILQANEIEMAVEDKGFHRKKSFVEQMAPHVEDEATKNITSRTIAEVKCIFDSLVRTFPQKEDKYDSAILRGELEVLQGMVGHKVDKDQHEEAHLQLITRVDSSLEAIRSAGASGGTGESGTGEAVSAAENEATSGLRKQVDDLASQVEKLQSLVLGTPSGSRAFEFNGSRTAEGGFAYEGTPRTQKLTQAKHEHQQTVEHLAEAKQRLAAILSPAGKQRLVKDSSSVKLPPLVPKETPEWAEPP